MKTTFGPLGEEAENEQMGKLCRETPNEARSEMRTGQATRVKCETPCSALASSKQRLYEIRRRNRGKALGPAANKGRHARYATKIAEFANGLAHNGH